MSAGATSNAAGQPSPFLLRLTRQDGEGELGSLELTAPKGFAAKLAGVPYCPEAAIASAAIRSGASEQASPSCRAASRIGTLAAAAGPGPNPYQVNGKAYLAGPYKGAPLSFVFIAPAAARPLRPRQHRRPRRDLHRPGNRPDDGQLRPAADGSSTACRCGCARSSSASTAPTSPATRPTANRCRSTPPSPAQMAPAPLRPNSFQVGGCTSLGFKPKLGLRLLGPTRRSALPKAAGDTEPAPGRRQHRPRHGDAAADRVARKLPHQGHLHPRAIRRRHLSLEARSTATRRPGARCSTGRWKGPFTCARATHRLPDLVASLDGQFHIDAVGRIDSVRGRIRGTLEALPDVPISKFVLTMAGGKQGLLVNNTELCRASPRVGALLEGQNGKVRSVHPLVRTDCGKK